MGDITDKKVRGRNLLLESLWFLLTGLFSAFIFFQVRFGHVSEHYRTGRYMFSVAFTLISTWVLIWLWWHFATNTVGPRMWIATHTGAASVVFAIGAFLCAAAFIVFCPYIYTPDKHNSLFMSAGLIFPMLFTGLMYLFPPIEIEKTILPIPGLAQTIVRVAQFVIWLAACVVLFVYNFI